MRQAESARGTSWLVSRPRRPGAAVGLYCFPHAGGAPGEYARWSDDLPGVQVRALRFPGRGSRLFEKPHTRMEDLVGAVVSAVTFEPPFVLFGHSLGALVAFEVARALRDHGEPAPELLIASACPPPSLIAPEPGRHLRPDGDLLAEIERQSGPLPAGIRDDPDLLKATLGAFRADLELLETYSFRPGDPLDCRLVVLSGIDDPAGSRMAEWRDHTTGPTVFREFPGGHFHFRERRHEVLSYVRQAIEGGEGAE